MSKTTTATPIVASGASFAMEGTPSCDVNPTDPACLSYKTSINYKFDFTGTAIWQCLDSSLCGVPADHIKLNELSPVPTIFNNSKAWVNQITAATGIALSIASSEVVDAIKAGNFFQCLQWGPMLSIPTKYTDPQTLENKDLPKLYMCGDTKAYLIKNPRAAQQISPQAFLKLSADAQSKNGAYDLTTHVAPFSATNQINPIDVVPYDKNSGRYSASYITGFKYQYGQVVNQANRVYKCTSAFCETQMPIKDLSGSIWTFQSDQPPPPSRLVNIDRADTGGYLNTKKYYNGDIAYQNGNYYTCDTDDQYKNSNGKLIKSNICNQVSNDLSKNLGVWSLIGAANLVNVDSPILAPPFNANYDYFINDYYSDSSASPQKVYKCVGDALLANSEVLCRKPYAAGTAGWKDITLDSNGNSVYKSSFDKLAGYMSFYAGWTSGAGFLQGDVIKDSASAFWLCLDSAKCSTTSPTATQTAWSKFDTSYGINSVLNPKWTQYDVNSNNINAQNQKLFTAFNDGVICKAATTATTKYLDRICDSVVPTQVRVCNKLNGCVAADVSSLPYTREVGYAATADIPATLTDATFGQFYAYKINTKYSAGDIVYATDNTKTPPTSGFWKVSLFDSIGAQYYGPYDIANQGIWLAQNQITNTKNLKAQVNTTPASQSCFKFTDYQLLGSNVDWATWYQRWNYGENLNWMNINYLTPNLNEYACDEDIVYKCIDATYCSMFNNFDWPEIWQATPFSPAPITPSVVAEQLDLDLLYSGDYTDIQTFVAEKVYKFAEYINDIFQFGEIAVLEDNIGNISAYKCATPNIYQCAKYAPGDTSTQNQEGSAAAWQKLPASEVDPQKFVVLNYVTNGIQKIQPLGKTTQQDYSKNYDIQTAQKWSSATNQQKYPGKTFQYGENVASDDGYLFTCVADNEDDCYTQDPTSETQTAWSMSPYVIVNQSTEPIIVQIYEFAQWSEGYPYVDGEIISGSSGQCFQAKDGYQASFSDPEDYDEYFINTYQQLDSNLYQCNPVNADVHEKLEAFSYADLTGFDATTCKPSTIQAGDHVFVNGRIFTCVQQCTQNQPVTSKGFAWALTNFIGTQKTATSQSQTFVSSSLPGCVSDLYATGDYLSYSLTDPNLIVTQGQVCSQNAEYQRQMAAGNPQFMNGQCVPNANPVNMQVYWSAIPPFFIDFITKGADITIEKQNIETAFASFPLFCNDPAVGVDPLLSCQQDVIGFFTYVLAADTNQQYPQENTEYYQKAFETVYDKNCYNLVYANANGKNITSIEGTFAVNGADLFYCNFWNIPQQNDVNAQFPEFQDTYYFRRGAGPQPLKGAADYGMFSQVIFGDKMILLQHPEYAEDASLTACIAMWGYMSYGRNGSTAPSFHDVFTGHWQPNQAESAIGLSADEPINALMSILASQIGYSQMGIGYSCYYFLGYSYPGSNALGDAAATYAQFLGTQVNTLQDYSCSNINDVYPEPNGPNDKLFLLWDPTQNNCQLTTTPTQYHAFRSGDMKACIVDGQQNFNYQKSAQMLKSTIKPFTEWQRDYPYALNGYASAVGFKTALQCLKPIACATTAVPSDSQPTSVWGVVTSQATGRFFDPALLIPPQVQPCIMWNQINSGTQFNPSFIDLMNKVNVQYVCDGTPLRVYRCLTSETDCLAVANKPSDTNIGVTWQIQEAAGVDQFNLVPQLVCADNYRYKISTTYSSQNWWYDWSDLEFKNYGSVCSYNQEKIRMISESFIYPDNTRTGLTDEQLAITSDTANQGAPFTQASVSSRQSIWSNAYKKANDALASSDATTVANTKLLLSKGTTKTDGSVTWQYDVSQLDYWTFTSSQEVYPYLQPRIPVISN